jgi:hypothetical protein
MISEEINFIEYMSKCSGFDLLRKSFKLFFLTLQKRHYYAIKKY